MKKSLIIAGALAALSVPAATQSDWGQNVLAPGENLTVPAFRYYRFTVKKLRYSGYYVNGDQMSDFGMQMSEIALYDADGNRLNQGLGFAGDNVDPASLGAGTFTLSLGSGQWHNNDNEGPEKLMDGLVDTKCFFGNTANLNQDDASTWIRFVMRFADDAAPVAGYNLATGGDDANYIGYRTPHSFALEGSADGVAWVTLSEVRQARVTTENNVYQNGGRPFFAAAPQYLVQPGSSLSVADGASLDSVLNNGGQVFVAANAAAVWPVRTGDTVTFVGGGLAGDGVVRKTGAGTLELDGVNPFAGRLAVEAGTLKFVTLRTPRAFTYYRFNAQENLEVNSGALQLAEIGLYDAAGKRVNGNLAFVGGRNGRGFEPLDPGSCYVFFPGGTFYANWNENEMPQVVFDGNLGSKSYWGGVKMEPDNGDTWISWLMRPAAGVAPVTSYLLASGGDDMDYTDRVLGQWMLEGSDDGSAWYKLSRVANDPRQVVENANYYHGGRAYPVQMPRGCYAVAQTGCPAKFYRFSIKETYRPDSGDMQISEIALYDVQGRRINAGLTDAGTDRLAAARLAPGTFTTDYPGGTFHLGGDQGSSAVFDNNLGTKTYWGGVKVDEADPSTWVRYVMRLADEAAPVAGYNIGTGGDDMAWQGRIPVSWRLEGSYDGESWFTLVDESNSPLAVPANAVWRNFGEPMGIDWQQADMLPPATVAVAPGATVEIGPHVAGAYAAIEVDCETGAGTFRNFRARKGLQLKLVNFNRMAAGQKRFVVPVGWEGTVDLSTLESWRVVLDGEVSTRHRLEFADGKLMVVEKPGLALLFR